MKVNENIFRFSNKILKVHNESLINENQDNEKPCVKEENRIIGSTDYKKYEDLSKKIELEEITNSEKTKEILKMVSNNYKENELYQPSKIKLEASTIFKSEGDDNVKLKKWEDALNSYEKALLQLFYNNSDSEEDQQVNRLKMAINLNVSLCKINLNQYDQAIGNCLEVLRIDKKNIKAVYRIAYSYFKKDNFDESYINIEKGLEIEKDNPLLIELKNDIIKRKQFLENESSKLFKKIIK